MTSRGITSARARGPGVGQQTTHPRWQLRVQGGSPPGLPGWAGWGERRRWKGRRQRRRVSRGCAAVGARGAAAGARAATPGASGGKLRTNLNLNAGGGKRTLRTSSCRHRPRARGLGLGGRATTSWACVAAQAGPLARSEGQARRQQAAAGLGRAGGSCPERVPLRSIRRSKEKWRSRSGKKLNVIVAQRNGYGTPAPSRGTRLRGVRYNLYVPHNPSCRSRPQLSACYSSESIHKMHVSMSSVCMCWCVESHVLFGLNGQPAPQWSTIGH